MKKITIIMFFLLILTNSKAQTPIFDIEDLDNITKDIRGAYYKDTKNQLNVYEGTYVYSNSNTSLKIVLQKKVMSSMNGVYFEDLIIGEYQYIENGIETTNTLDKLAINYTDQGKHNIHGRSILTGAVLGCRDCSPTEKRLRVGLIDDKSENTASMSIRRISVNGQPAIKIKFQWRGPIAHREGTPMPPPSGLSAGEYVLVKQ
jgi:hypothetical protein